MKAVYLYTIGALSLTFGLAACVPSVEAPAPIPAPVARPAPTPMPTPQPVPIVQEQRYENYLDAPQTPGNWEYLAETDESFALFGEQPRQPAFLAVCKGNQVGLARVLNASSASSRLMAIKTETVTRQLQADPWPGRQGVVGVRLSAGDPLLDAMAITKGRFAVQVEGERTLYLPAWVELSRVIEDCR